MLRVLPGRRDLRRTGGRKEGERKGSVDSRCKRSSGGTEEVSVKGVSHRVYRLKQNHRRRPFWVEDVTGCFLTYLTAHQYVTYSISILTVYLFRVFIVQIDLFGVASSPEVYLGTRVGWSTRFVKCASMRKLRVWL